MDSKDRNRRASTAVGNYFCRQFSVRKKTKKKQRHRDDGGDGGDAAAVSSSSSLSPSSASFRSFVLLPSSSPPPPPPPLSPLSSLSPLPPAPPPPVPADVVATNSCRDLRVRPPLTVGVEQAPPWQVAEHFVSEQVTREHVSVVPEPDHADLVPVELDDCDAYTPSDPAVPVVSPVSTSRYRVFCSINIIDVFFTCRRVL